MIIPNVKDKLFSSSLIRGSSLTVVFRFASVGVNFLLYLLLARYYGAEEVGAFSTLITFLNLLLIFSIGGSDLLLIKLLANKDVHKHYAFFLSVVKFSFINCILIIVFLCAARKNISHYLLDGYFRSEEIFYLTLLIPFTSVIFITSDYYRGRNKLLEYNLIRDFSRFFLTFLITLILIYSSHADYFKPSLVFTISTFLVFISILLQQGLVNKNVIVSIQMSELLSYLAVLKRSFYFLLSNAAFFLTSWVSIILLGFLSTADQVGVYSISFKIANLLTVPIVAVNSVVTPSLARHYLQGNFRKLQSVCLSAVRLTTLLMVPGALFVLTYPGLLLNIVGDNFDSGTSSLQILCIGYVVNVLCGPNAALLKMSNNEKVYQKVVSVFALTCIVLNVVLIPRYGIEGAALATSFSIMGWNIVGAIIVKKRLQINTFITLKR